MADELVQATDSTFTAEVLQSDLPVLVDFWATWCMPCKAMEPQLVQLAKEHAGKIKVVKLNVEKNRQTPMSFGVSNLPTLLVFKGGKVVANKTGAGGGYGALKSLVAPFV